MNSSCAAALWGVLRPAAVACGVQALEEAPSLGSPWLFQLRVQVFLPSGLPHRAVLPGALQMLFLPGWSHRSALAALALGLQLVAREKHGGDRAASPGDASEQKPSCQPVTPAGMCHERL